MLAAISLIAVSLVIKGDLLSGFARVAVALIPVPFFVVMLVAGVRFNRRLDERARQIQLEALAIAFLGTGVFVMTWGQLERVDVLPGMNAGTVWAPMSFIYMAGYFFSLRRYS